MGRYYHQGTYKVQNPEKCLNGNTAKYKSSLEKRAMTYFDLNENVIKWGYEVVKIPYYFPLDKKNHQYHIDFYTEIKTLDGSIVKQLIEVKPSNETTKPKPPKNKNAKRNKRYLTEQVTYIRNQCKWKNAEDFCKNKNMQWVILTENDLR